MSAEYLDVKSPPKKNPWWWYKSPLKHSLYSFSSFLTLLSLHFYSLLPRKSVFSALRSSVNAQPNIIHSHDFSQHNSHGWWSCLFALPEALHNGRSGREALGYRVGLMTSWTVLHRWNISICIEYMCFLTNISCCFSPCKISTATFNVKVILMIELDIVLIC